MLDKSKFASLRAVSRVWAIAAIHGEAARLAQVHEQIARRFEPGDRLVYLGNYMGHGGEIRATLDTMLGFRRALLAEPGMMTCDVVFLRGAQEEMWSKLMQLHLALDPGSVLAWMLERGLDETLAAYGGSGPDGLARARGGATELARWTNELRTAIQAQPGHANLMSALKRAAFTEEGALLFVHAGLDATRPLAVQGDDLWWGDGFESIDGPYDGFKLIVRGFDRAGHGVAFTAHTATLDGGCGFGNPLHAACFDLDGKVVERIEG
ncbi:MAG: hypothetical protein VCB77_09045 [Alphaproteobacteria bacterium]